MASLTAGEVVEVTPVVVEEGAEGVVPVKRVVLPTNENSDKLLRIRHSVSTNSHTCPYIELHRGAAPKQEPPPLRNTNAWDEEAEGSLFFGESHQMVSRTKDRCTKDIHGESAIVRKTIMIVKKIVIPTTVIVTIT